MRRLALLSALVASACQSAPPPAPTQSEDERARGAAAAFLSCFERDGAECRAAGAPARPWAALEALALVEEAIPTRIIVELPGALDAVRDEARVRRAFITELRTRESWARAAACEVRGMQPVGQRVLALARAAAQRVDRLALADTEMGAAVTELVGVVQSLRAARLVQVDCAATRRTFYLALAAAGDQGATWYVMALLAEPPEWLQAGARAAPLERPKLAPAGPNFVDPWLPVYEEQL